MDIIKENPKINLVLSDVMMEGMSGYDLLINIRKIRKTMAVVLISAYESIDLVESCILSGADAYLMKPLRVHELRNIWQYVWRRRHEAALQLRNMALLQSTADDIGHSDTIFRDSPASSVPSPTMPAPNLSTASKMKGERQRLASRLSDMQELNDATRQVRGAAFAPRMFTLHPPPFHSPSLLAPHSCGRTAGGYRAPHAETGGEDAALRGHIARARGILRTSGTRRADVLVSFTAGQLCRAQRLSHERSERGARDGRVIRRNGGRGTV